MILLTCLCEGLVLRGQIRKMNQRLVVWTDFLSTEWMDMFPDYSQRALARPVSDQYPLLLETGMDDWGPPPFRFEIAL